MNLEELYNISSNNSKQQHDLIVDNQLLFNTSVQGIGAGMQDGRKIVCDNQHAQPMSPSLVSPESSNQANENLDGRRILSPSD